MANTVIEAESGGLGKDSWNGVALAEAAERDDIFSSTVDMLREDGDGASTSSSCSSAGCHTNGDESSNKPWNREEKILEELFRLKLTSVAPSALNGTAAPGASLPPKQRIGLYQPRTKLEQFEDVLIESQLLEASLPEFEVAAFAEAAGLSATDLDLNLTERFDFEASDAIFHEDENAATSTDKKPAMSPIKIAKDNDTKDEKALAESHSNTSLSTWCDCVTCCERRSAEVRESDELERLRKSWLDVREDVWRIYHLVLCNAWNDPNRFDERPDLKAVKEKVQQLVRRDAHQLFLRLEAGVREFVLEIKLKLVELLQKQAKSITLAQDFIQYLMISFERFITAASMVAPVLEDLVSEHLSKFSLNWHTLNSHLYQTIIYSDPVIENSLPIFLSQLRLSSQDKDAEAMHTELIRSYLDLDVEMANAKSNWDKSESMITEFNQHQNLMRAKQRMLKEDWERFKAQRKDAEKQLKSKEAAIGCRCDFCLTPVLPPLDHSTTTTTTSPSKCSSMQTSATGNGDCISSVRKSSLNCAVDKMLPDLSKLYPHLYQTIMQGGTPSCASTSLIQDPKSQTLTSTSIGDVTSINEGKNDFVNQEKLSVAAELSQALSTALSLADEPVVNGGAVNHSSETIHQNSSTCCDAKTQQDLDSCSTASSNGDSQTQNKTSSKKSNADVNKLFQQHYCSHKNRRKHPVPSASAIRKGKVPPPASCVLGDGDSTDEMSEDSSSIAQDDTCCSSASSAASGHGAHNNGKPCSCTYCEAFGHNKTTSAAPVSRNYAEMRERLRLLLNKKKKEQARNKQQQARQQQQQQQHFVSSTASSCSSTSSIKSTSSIPVKKESTSILLSNVGKGKTVTVPSAVPAAKTVPKSAAMAASKPTVTVTKQNAVTKPEVLLAKNSPVGFNSQTRSHSATNLVKPVNPIQGKIAKSSSAVVTQPKTNVVSKPTDIDSVLQFIEGGVASADEKKRLKKERQKAQKFEEIRARELAERLKREAAEAERKRLEEEEQARLEAERQMAKKAKKKAAQRAKKAASKGMTVEELDILEGKQPPVPVTNCIPSNPSVYLEDLRARQIRELRELQEKHQKQFEEEQRKLKESLEAQSAATQNNASSSKQSKKSKKKANKNKENSEKPAAVQNKTELLSAVSKAAPGTQIKITRTASGGVEFTTVPADGAPAKKLPTGGYNSAASIAPVQAAGPPPYLQNMMFGQGPVMQPYMPTPPPPAQPSFLPSSNSPSADRPSVPSKMTPSQPMVTIRRIENPQMSEPTVTISVQGEKENNKKLLYTLINGQIHKAKDAPLDLIPDAKPLPPDFAKKMSPNIAQQSSYAAQSTPNAQSLGSFGNPAPRPPLPTDNHGKLDLNRLQLPPGISITKIQGTVPERKYFPSKPDTEQTLLTLPEALNPQITMNNHHQQQQSAMTNGGGFGYSAMAGLPSGLNGPNVIVVDTSTLKTREEERLEAEAQKKKKKKKKSTKKEGDQQVPQSSPVPEQSLGAYPYLAPQIPEDASRNSLKSGPQVLIKNVNGNVVITPIPSIDHDLPNATTSKKTASKVKSKNETEGRRARPATKNGKTALGENIDEINSIFAPKDIDLENGEIDEDEKEIEAFKRFCFDSVPLQQKTKVNFDVKNIAFKKK